MAKIWGLILAAGQSSRLAQATGGLAKQFLPLGDAPLYWRSAQTFAACARLQGLVLVFPPELLSAEQGRIKTLRNIGLPIRAVAGGQERRDSVRLGLAALDADCDVVLVHDAARPFASASLVNRVLDALESSAANMAVIPGMPVADTIKITSCQSGTRVVESTPRRDLLFAVQTPQGFRTQLLRQAHDRAVREEWSATDDAMLMEYCGHRVVVVEGEASNHKITTPEDLALLQEKTEIFPRTGWGYDVHRFAPPSCEQQGDKGQNAHPLRLGGVLIPGSPDILAHSDGDVLLHALMDALLGCAGAGDIGQYFPDNDAAYAGIDSVILLDEVLERIYAVGFRPLHVDLTVIAQIPKIAPHREAIRRNVARLLSLPLGAVNIKATSEEGLGFTGAKEGIKAVALVTGMCKVKK